MATLLGFLDDVFDIRWLHKLPIPIIASIPLLVVYYAERGNTNVVVPLPLRPIFGTLLDIGMYMSLKILPPIERISRSPVLRLYVLIVHILHKQH